MADRDIDMGRFAHDVCVHVLEKFGIFKAADDTRVQNKYMCNDFLPCISKSVVTYAIWMRDSFKNALEEEYKSADPSNKEKMWNVFNFLLNNDTFKETDYAGKMCMSLALCTEYIQFVNTKDFRVSLNKIVINWNEFFQNYLRNDFEAEGSLTQMYFHFKSTLIDVIDDYLKAFISEYLLPYGDRECTRELAKKCAEEHGIQLDIAVFGIKKRDSVDESISMETSEERKMKDFEKSPRNPAETKEPNLEGSGTSDSDDNSKSTSTCETCDSEIPPSIESETSDCEMSQNKLLGIPPHEEMLREIDPFFVENIPSPPKAQSNIAASSDAPLASSPQDAVAASSDAPLASSPQDAVAASSDALLASSPQDAVAASSDAPLADSISPVLSSSGTPPLSKSLNTISSDKLLSSPELEKMVEQILSKVERDMDALRRLLFDQGVLSRRGTRMRYHAGNMPPKGPEGLI